MLQIIDVKKENQTVLMALAQFEIELEKLRQEKVVAFKVLHGYGSHGKGGEIKKSLHKLLTNLKRQKQILDFVHLENANSKSLTEFALKKCPELILDNDIKNQNSGMTLIIIG